MEKFDTDFYEIYACKGEVCIQNIGLSTNTTHCVITLSEIIEALLAARDVAFPTEEDEPITYYEACPNCRNASYEGTGGGKVVCRACSRMYWHERDEPATTGLTRPDNGYVMLSEPLVKHDEGAYIKRGSLDELIGDYVCGGSNVYELGVELKPEREVRWVEVRDDD